MKSPYFVAFNADYMTYDVIKRSDIKVVRTFSDKEAANSHAEHLNDSSNLPTNKLLKYHKEATSKLIKGNLPRDSYNFQVYRLEAIGRELEKRFGQMTIDY
jgi:hypothetical protein